MAKEEAIYMLEMLASLSSYFSIHFERMNNRRRLYTFLDDKKCNFFYN